LAWVQMILLSVDGPKKAVGVTDGGGPDSCGVADGGELHWHVECPNKSYPKRVNAAIADAVGLMWGKELAVGALVVCLRFWYPCTCPSQDASFRQFWCVPSASNRADALAR
jgi:hypothetical protein